MLDTDLVRRAFPHLARGTYLNTAAAGLSWEGQGKAAAEFYDVGKAKGMAGAHEWAANVRAAREELSHLMEIAPHRIHFVGSTTEALNLVALSLPLQRGDKVLIAADEFPSVIDSWTHWQTQGVELVKVAIDHEDERTETLCNAINSDIRAVAVSHVHWRTGTRVDLDKLRERCNEHDSRLIVDGVQAVGAVAVNAGLADAYCASVFKWLISGFGLGFVTLSERLAGELLPVMRGYNNEPPSRSLSYSHINYPGVYALRASLEYLRSLGWSAIHSQVDTLTLRAIASLRSRGFNVVTPVNARAGIVSVEHPSASALVHALANQGIFVEDRGSIVRASPHFYNTEEEIDRFVSALAHAA